MKKTTCQNTYQLIRGYCASFLTADGRIAAMVAMFRLSGFVAIVGLIAVSVGCSLRGGARAPEAYGLSIKEDKESLTITTRGKPVLTYHSRPATLPRKDIPPIYLRGGYIHPVITPGGVRVTDDYPTNHLHHHGIWFAWTNTRFENRRPDFWNMGSNKGTVEFVALHGARVAGTDAGFRAEHKYIDLLATPAKTALQEMWEVTAVFDAPKTSVPAYVFDLVSTQHCASPSSLALPRYHYGGLGFRGHEQWNGATVPRFLTSEGETNRLSANETRARWCRISGEVDGKTVGIAILDHPENFRAPQPIRVHPTEPFFCYAPSQLGDWEIVPDQAYISRYRFVVFDGELPGNEIERLWRNYARTGR